MRPMLRDFPSDSYYRLFDIVQLLYKPSFFVSDEVNEERLEIIIVKGTLKVPYTIELSAPDETMEFTLRRTKTRTFIAIMDVKYGRSIRK